MMQMPVREFVERYLTPHLIRFRLLSLFEARVCEQTTPRKISGRHEHELDLHH